MLIFSFLFSSILCQTKYNIGVLTFALNPPEGFPTMNGTVMRLAVETGLEYVNQNKDVTPTGEIILDFRVVGTDGDVSKIEESDKVKTAYNSLLLKNTLGIIGPSLSSSFEKLTISNTPISIPILSVAERTDLTDINYFVRLSVNSEYYCRAMIDMLFGMGVREAALIYNENEEFSRNAKNDCIDRFNNISMNVDVLSYSFTEQEDPEIVLELLKQTEKRAVILVPSYVRSIVLENFFKTVHMLGMEKGYTWVIDETFARRILPYYSQKEIPDYFNGLIYAEEFQGFFKLDSFFYLQMEKKSGIANKKLLGYYKKFFDAILIYAQSIKKLEDTYIDPHDPGEMLDALYSTNTIGAYGRYKIIRKLNGEKRPNIRLNNIQLNSSFEVTTRPIAEWAIDDVFEWEVDDASEIVFPGGEVRKDLELSRRIPRADDLWIRIPEHGISPQTSHSYCSVVYEDLYFIIFGGAAANDIYNNIYYFTLKTGVWSEIEPIDSISPFPRKNHDCTVMNSRMYSFGGYNHELVLDDMWNYNILKRRWTRTESYGDDDTPDGRYGHSMGRINDYERKLIIYGGIGNSYILGDLWFFHTYQGTFDKVELGNALKPRPRYFHRMIITNVNVAYIFGGLVSVINEVKKEVECVDTNELWSFNVSSRSWKMHSGSLINEPEARYSHGMSYIGNYLYLINGYSIGRGSELNEIFRLNLIDFREWEVIEPQKLSQFVSRCDIQLSVFDQQIIIFGGRNGINISSEIDMSDFWVFDTVTNYLNAVHGDFFSPDTFSKNAAFIYSENLFTFGGTNSKFQSVNTIYKMNIEKIRWELVEINSELQPEPRCLFCHQYIGERLYVYGGTNEATGDVFNDLWMFSPQSNDFYLLSSSSSLESPGLRYDCSMIEYDNVIYIFGGYGYNQRVLPKRYYKFDIQTRSWESEKYVSEVDTAVSKCKVHIGTKGVFLLIGCVHGGGIILNNIWKLDVFSKKNTLPEMTLFAELDPKYNLFNTGVSKFFLFSGEDQFGFLTNNFAIFTIGDDDEVSIQKIETKYLYPYPRKYTSCNYYKGEFLCLGGVLGFPFVKGAELDVWIDSNYGLAIRNFMTSNVWCYNFNNLLDYDLECADGSMMHEGELLCESCREGTYGAYSSCYECPPGFFSNTKGIASPKSCLPCDYNTYNPNWAATRCLPCNETEDFCPMASDKKLPKSSKYEDKAAEVIPPKYYHSQTEEANFVMLFVQIGCIVTALTTFSMLYAMWRIGAIKMELLLLCDCLLREEHEHEEEIEDHHIFEPEPRMMKRTVCGACWSMVAFGLVSTFVACAIYLWSFNLDDDESFGLVPNAILAHTQGEEDFEGVNMQSRLEIHNYVGECVYEVKKDLSIAGEGECSPRFGIFGSEDLEGDIETKCTKIGNNTCLIEINIDKLIVGKEAVSSDLTIDVENPNSFTSLYKYEIKVQTGYENKIDTWSTVEGVISGDKKKLFRGPQPPTVVNLEIIQTEYEHPKTLHKIEGEGYHLDFKSIELGNQVGVNEFANENGFVFKFSLQRSDYLLKIERENEQTWFTFFPELLGGCLGLMEGVVFLLKIIEYIYCFLGFKNDVTDLEKSEKKRRKHNFRHWRKKVEHLVRMLFQFNYKSIPEYGIEKGNQLKRSLLKKKIVEEAFKKMGYKTKGEENPEENLTFENNMNEISEL